MKPATSAAAFHAAAKKGLELLLERNLKKLREKFDAQLTELTLKMEQGTSLTENAIFVFGATDLVDDLSPDLSPGTTAILLRKVTGRLLLALLEEGFDARQVSSPLPEHRFLLEDQGFPAHQDIEFIVLTAQKL